MSRRTFIFCPLFFQQPGGKTAPTSLLIRYSPLPQNRNPKGALASEMDLALSETQRL